MQRWDKYIVDMYGEERRPLDLTSFETFERIMGGYGPDDAYATKRQFFDAHLSRRFSTYDAFAGKWLSGKRVFSIASGRGVNEMLLKERGYEVTCSDLGVPKCYEPSKKLFGEYDYLALDITASAPPSVYDSIMCLSCIFLFDNQRLDAVFENIVRGLRKGGRLILDPSGPAAGIRSYIYHNMILPIEAHAYTLYHNWRMKDDPQWRVVRERQGWRRTNGDIVARAASHGLELLAYEESDYETEISRSIFLGSGRGQSGLVSQMFRNFVGKIPYIRMFAFKKR